MTTRKVSAIEEKVLALAVEWAEKREAWEADVKANHPGGPSAYGARQKKRVVSLAKWATLVAATRLLKQRRAKGEDKR
jgi:hypothetical protein